ncbi:MAG: SsrA-binding protein SmpB [Bacteroidota bacterium]
MSEKSPPPTIKNRKARHEYSVEETYEAGIVLKGTEVKSLRAGKASLNEAFAMVENGEVWLREMYIKPYEQGSYFNTDPRRPRKLLLHKSEIRKIQKHIEQEGYTIVPLKLYFKKGYAKVLIGVAKGKKKYDKRQDIKERDAQREIERKYSGQYKINM